MRAFGILMFLAAIFIIFNSNTIREVIQGKTKVNIVNINSGTSNGSTSKSSN